MTSENTIQRIERAITESEHKPSQWASAMTRMGGITTYDPENKFKALLAGEPEVCWASFEYKRDGWLAIEAVNSLPPLLELAAAALAWREAQTDGFASPAEMVMLNAIDKLVAKHQPPEAADPSAQMPSALQDA